MALGWLPNLVSVSLSIHQKSSFKILEICVKHPDSPTCENNSTKQIYNFHEARKMKKYHNRIIQVEKRIFTPLIETT